MISYAPHLADYFRYSNRFYYLVIDLHGKFTYVNPAFQDQFKFISSNFSGNQIKDISIFSENQIAKVLDHCIQHPYIPVTTQMKLDVAKFSKTIQWEFSALIDENGKTTAIQAVGVNVNDNHKS